MEKAHFFPFWINRGMKKAILSLSVALAQRDIVVVISFVACDVLYDPNEWRELHRFVRSHPLCLKNEEARHGSLELIKLEILPLPDEAAPCLPDGLPIGIGLL